MREVHEPDGGNARGKVLWHVTMSLDGFIAGRDDSMDWMTGYATSLADEVIRTTGAVLAGRRGYELGRQRGSKPYGGAWMGPQFVLTHNPPDSFPDPTITFLSEPIQAAVDTALEAADGKNLVLFGASIGRQCIERGLVDELLVHLVPVLLGDGLRLLQAPGSQRVTLERIGLGQSGQVTDLRFRVVK
ncbi:MAG TPA: dihydrofolate reductase family protein [Actinomycetes bacterium]|jgi:dihydrofolate reductase|nr:dihydrofolate reductase family protein [Actinomycetes bacterium]